MFKIGTQMVTLLALLELQPIKFYHSLLITCIFSKLSATGLYHSNEIIFFIYLFSINMNLINTMHMLLFSISSTVHVKSAVLIIAKLMKHNTVPPSAQPNVPMEL